MGEDRLDLELGTQVGFLQDLVALQLQEREESDESNPTTTNQGHLTVLGHVKHRIVVTPDWEHLFSKAPK